jgi:hypothetical protein
MCSDDVALSTDRTPDVITFLFPVLARGNAQP